MHAEEPTQLGGMWGLPLVGLAGTAAGMLIAFTRIGTEPHWETALVAVGFSVVVVAASLIVLKLAVQSRRY
jgi:multisubunit Na+/H+ antiporter MnhF subunit